MKREVLVAELARLRDKHGRVTPEIVVREAAQEGSPLHKIPAFRWGDDAKAAYAHRLDVARTLIASVQVRITENNITLQVPVYVRDPDAAPRAQGYRAVEYIGVGTSEARAVVAAEINRAVGCLRRARDLAVVLGCADQIEEMSLAVAALAQEVAAPTPARRAREARVEKEDRAGM